MKKMVQGKYTLNKEPKPSLSELMTWPAFFLHQFLCLVLLLLLYHSDKIAIPHYHLFLLLKILHLILFKLLQRQDELIISGDRVVLRGARDDNRRLSFLGGADLPFFWNGFVAIYFQPIFDHQFQSCPPHAATMW